MSLSFFGQPRLDGSQPVELRTALPLLQLGVGHDGEQSTVGVVEELGPDEVLEEASFAACLLQAFEVGVEIQRREGVPAVQVRGHRGEQEAQRVGKARVRALALLELEVVDGGVDHGLVHAAVGHSFEGVEHNFLDICGVFGGDPFQAGAENRLLEVVVQPASVSQRAAQARIDQRLAQR